MRRRSRLLRVAKWGGVVVCVLLASAWLVSLGRSLGYLATTESRTQMVGIGAGTIWWTFLKVGVSGLPEGWSAEPAGSVVWWPEYRSGPSVSNSQFRSGFRWLSPYSWQRDLSPSTAAAPSPATAPAVTT